MVNPKRGAKNQQRQNGAAAKAETKGVTKAAAKAITTAAPKNGIVLGYEGGSGHTSQKIAVLELKRANRHGLIAGATGTGKTVTLQMLAESFSDAGVPGFLSDVKGDLSGVSQAGSAHPKVIERLEALGFSTKAWRGTPTVFWDVYGKQGHPVRATIPEVNNVEISTPSLSIKLSTFAR